MAATQHVMTYPDYLKAGGAPPGGVTPAPTAIVIACSDDTTGDVLWVSYAPADVPVTGRLNPSILSKDWR